MGFPHDLVTVIRELAALVQLYRSLEEPPGRQPQVRAFLPSPFSQETCLLLVREQMLQITRNWLYRKAQK